MIKYRIFLAGGRVVDIEAAKIQTMEGQGHIDHIRLFDQAGGCIAIFCYPAFEGFAELEVVVG